MKATEYRSDRGMDGEMEGGTSAASLGAAFSFFIKLRPLMPLTWLEENQWEVHEALADVVAAVKHGHFDLLASGSMS